MMMHFVVIVSKILVKFVIFLVTKMNLVKTRIYDWKVKYFYAIADLTLSSHGPKKGQLRFLMIMLNI